MTKNSRTGNQSAKGRHTALSTLLHPPERLQPGMVGFLVVGSSGWPPPPSQPRPTHSQINARWLRSDRRRSLSVLTSSFVLGPPKEQAGSLPPTPQKVNTESQAERMQEVPAHLVHWMVALASHLSDPGSNLEQEVTGLSRTRTVHAPENGSRTTSLGFECSFSSLLFFFFSSLRLLLFLISHIFLAVYS